MASHRVDESTNLTEVLYLKHSHLVMDVKEKNKKR